MDRGHVKLWRKAFDSGLIQNPNLWTFWTWCLLKASWKERNVIVNFQCVKIQPGQFVFGRKIAANELRMSEQVVRTCLKSLKNMKNLTIQPTNKYSIISIVNWDAYQGPQPTTNQLANQQLTTSQPASNQHLTTDKKERKKEVKKKETQKSDKSDTLTGVSFKIKNKPENLRSYLANIKKSCATLMDLAPGHKMRKLNPYQWAQEHINKNAHLGAMDEVLKALINQWSTVKTGYYGWLNALLKKKSPMYWEKEELLTSEEYKNSLLDIASQTDLFAKIGINIKNLNEKEDD